MPAAGVLFLALGGLASTIAMLACDLRRAGLVESSPQLTRFGHAVKRRLILKGTAGAALVAPFLSSLGGPARAQAAAAPRRLVIFHTSNGCLTNRWFPEVEDGELDAAAIARTTLAPLAPFGNQLLFPRGLGMFPHGTVEVDGVAYFDPDDQAMGSKLTCAPIDPVGEHWALGRSLDHVVADHVNAAGTGPLVLSVGTAFANVKGVLSYEGARMPVPPETNPTEVYGALTGILTGAEPSEADYRVARGKSIIDMVRADLDTFQRQDMSQSDQQKIAQWLELLRETELAASNLCNLEQAMKLGITQAALEESSSSNDSATAFTLGGDMMLRLIALTLMCDANRSIVFQWPGFVTFKWDGINHTHDHAGLSHRTGSASIGGNCLDGVLDMLAEIDAWFAGRFAKLVALLDGIDEGERTLLGNSAVMWLPQLSDGLAHNVNNLPIVIAGSAGGYLRQGVSVNLTDGVLGAGNSEGSCREPGAMVEFGTGSDYGDVPLNKLYVTLLNALGATNAGAPLESFGQVDSNELALGITDPGELDALRA